MQQRIDLKGGQFFAASQKCPVLNEHHDRPQHMKLLLRVAYCEIEYEVDRDRFVRVSMCTHPVLRLG